MDFIRLIPSGFCTDIRYGLPSFVECLQFSIEHKELDIFQPYCVLGKDGIRIMVLQDAQLAREHYPEPRIETRDIADVFAKVSAFLCH